MSLGSFLAGAGRVGQGIRAEQATMRQDRAQQLALEELNRQNEFRRLQLEAPAPTFEVPTQGFTLGAPMAVIEPMVVPVAPAPAPASAPTPSAKETPTFDMQALRDLEAEVTRPGVKGKRDAAAQAGATRRTVSFAGVNVPVSFDSRDPDKLGTGVAGFKKIDPNASDADRTILEARNTRLLDERLSRMSYASGYMLSSVRKPFATQDQKKLMERGDRAARWYNSDRSRQYFRRNPEMLSVAERDPVKFYETILQGAKAPASAPAPKAPAPAPKASASQQVKIQGFQEALNAIPANDPYRRILGLEGGIDNKTGRFKTSPAGAVGPAQLMPSTAPEAMELAGFSRNDTRWKTDPYINIAAGRAYYNMLVQRFDGDVTKAAAAYNAGAGRVDSAVRKAERSGLSWVDHMPATETRKYVRDFLSNSGRATRFIEGGAAAPQQAGVNTGTTPSAPPTRIDPSNFYLANEGMITQDMRVALQNRQELARMADMYRRAGMGDQFTQTRLKVQDLDNSMLFLQGMQGIGELAYANDPRRIAAVWSQYAGVPIELQPQTDGTYNIVVNGKTTQRGLAPSTITDTARSAFDAEYRKSRTESSSAIALEQFKSQLRIGEEQAKAVLQAAREAQNFVLKGQNDQAIELVKQLDPNGKITPLGDGTGRSYLQVQGQTFMLDPGGNPIEGTDLTTAPSAAPIAGLQTRSVGIGTGG